MQQTSDQLRSWFRNVEPICAELFNAAHAMCGNYDLAEYALRSAILDVWLQNAGSGMGFRERLRGALRREAFDAALGPGADLVRSADQMRIARALLAGDGEDARAFARRTMFDRAAVISQ